MAKERADGEGRVHDPLKVPRSAEERLRAGVPYSEFMFERQGDILNKGGGL